MNEIETVTNVSDARENYEQIKTLRKSINLNFWQLVERLKTARENRQWVVIGCNSWRDYLAQPEIDLNEGTVNNYISIFDKLSKYLRISDMYDKLLPFDIDIGKLALIAPRITEQNAEELLEKAKTLSRSDLREEIRELKPLPKTVPLPEGEFNIVYADPPWRYRFSETVTREIENQYPTMELEEIKSLKIPVSENSIIFMWATAPKLEEAMQVLLAWGFDYRTCAIWDKEIIGMGYWFRGQHELLLVGVKGEFPTPDEGKRVSSVYRERRGEHSKKPTYFYDLIESYFPNGKYLELFAREKHNDKWTVWGNQL